MTRALYRHTAFSRVVSTIVTVAFILSLTGMGYAAPPVTPDPAAAEAVAPAEVGTPASDVAEVPATETVTPEPEPVPDPGKDPGSVVLPVAPAPVVKSQPAQQVKKSIEAPVRTAEPGKPAPVAKRATTTESVGVTPAVVTVQGSNIGDIVEGYRLTPASQVGWANSNLGKDYKEGNWVPWRLVLGPNGSATQTVSPATIQLDHRNGGTIGFDRTRNWTYYTTTTAPTQGNSPGVPSGTTPALAYQDNVRANGGGVDEYLETQITNIVIPPNGYAVIYFQAHLSLTGYWRNQTPSYLGSSFFSGSSLQVGFLEGGRQRVQLPLPPVPEGTLYGVKYNDYNHNNVQDAGEPGIPGWHFDLTGHFDGFDLSHDATSGAGGAFTVPYLIDGTWTLNEVPQAGWTNSTPLPMTIVVSNGDVVSVNGQPWVDGTPVKIGNYVPDVTKTFRLTVPSQVPEADSYFVRYTYTKPGESSVTTDLALAGAGGVYEASVNVPYNTVINSWQFFARMGAANIALTSSAGPETLTANRTNPGTYTPGIISGYKKIDSDRSGTINAGDANGAGWTINLYRNGVLYATTTTGADGSYTFGGLLPGSYTVSEVEDANFTRIIPAGANEFGPFTVASGSSVSTGTTFLNQPKLASVEITKTGPDMAHPGDTIDYVITVQNTGLVTLTDVTITDPLFDPDLVINVGTLAPGEVYQTTVPYTIPANASGSVDNTATVMGGSFFGLTTDSDDWTVEILNPAIDVTKVANPIKVTLTEAEPSKPVTYTITITNTGDATLTVDAADYVGGLVRFDLTPSTITLGPGDSESFEVVDQISEPTTDTAVATGVDIIGGPEGTVEDSATAHVAVDVVKTFRLTFSGSVPPADRYFASYVAGGQTYEVTLSPTGNPLVYTGTATHPYGTVITSWQIFAEVGGVDIALKPAHGSETLDQPMTNDETYTPGSIAGMKYIDNDLSGTISAGDTPGAGWTIQLYRSGVMVGSVVTTGSGAYTFGNLLPGSYTVREVQQATYDKVIPAGAELGPYAIASGSATTGANFLNRPKLVSIDVEKYSVTQAHVGDTIQYTITVRNSGEATLTNVYVFDPLFDPELDFLIPVLVPGEVMTMTATLTDYLVPDDVDPVDNTVYAHGDGPFGPVDDEDMWTVDVIRPQIDVTKVANPIKVTLTEDEPSKPVTYTITITNTGDTTLTVDAADYVGGLVRFDLTPSTITLGPGESESFEVVDRISEPTTDTAVATGVDIIGGPEGTVEDSATAHVAVDVVKTFALTLGAPVTGATGYGVTYIAGGVSTDLALAFNAGTGAYESQITVPYGTEITSWTFWALIGGEKYNLLPAGGPETLDAPLTNDGDFTPGIISGKKLIDDGDGILEPAVDAAGPGWDITLYRNGQSWATTTTAADGSFSFAGLIPGLYTLSEAMKVGYVQLLGPDEIMVVSGTDADEAYFLNRQLPVDIDVDKSSVTSAHVGDTIVYDITVTNSGDTTLTNVVVFDPLFDPDLNYLIPILGPGQSVDIPVSLTDYVVPDVDHVDNTVFVSGDGPFGPVDDEDSWVVEVLEPAIDVTKVANPTKVTLTEDEPSKPVTYTITITNTGDTTLTVDAADYVGGLVRFDLTPSTITLGPGESESFEVVDQISEPTTDTAVATGVDVIGGPSGTVEDSATAHVDVDLVKTFELTLTEAIPAADSFGVTYEIDENSVDMALVDQGGGVYSETVTVPYGTVIDSWYFYAMIDGEKVALSETGGPETLEEPMTNPFEFTPGEIFGTKRIDVNRNGDVDAGDTLGAGWEITLYRGEDVYATTTTDANGVFTFTGLVPGDYSLDETMQDSYVMVFGPDPFTVPLGTLGGVEQGPSDPFVLRGLDFLNQPAAPSINIVKSVDKPAVINGDGDVVYTYTITNDGDVPLSDLTLVDDKLGAITLPQSTLDVDESIVVTAPATIGVTTTNLATVDAVDEWDTPVTAEDTAIVQVFNPSISITKTVDPTVVLAGETVVYTYTVTNTGDVTLRDVTVTDDQLAEFLANLGDLEPDESAVATTSAPISVDTTNVATAEGDVREEFPVPGSDLPFVLQDTVSDTDDAFVDVVNPAIDVEKSADAEFVIVGETVTYTYVVTNIGDVDLFNVVIDDDKLGIIDTLDSLLVGESVTRTASTPLTLPTTNTVTATGTDRYQHEVSDEDTVFVDVAPPFTPGDMAITKSADATQADPGDLVKYTVTYWNTGGDPIPEFTIVDDYDQRYATVVDAAGGTVNTTNGTITWTGTDLRVEDGKQTITYTVRIKASMPDGTTNVDNVVVATAPGDDNPDNNRATWRVKVVVSEPFLPFTGANMAVLIGLALMAALAGIVLRRASRA